MAHPIMYDEQDPLLARVRELALDLPGAAEKVSHGRPNFFTTKVFAVYGGGRKLAPGKHERHDHALLFFADPVELPALDQDENFFSPAYLGPFGWRAVDLDVPGTDWAEITELIETSYRLTAPKKLIAELDAR
ncbi:MAG: MmcQ/YjbR family DNA-binding protein [Nocardioidaceae bacterium]|nr:MAG: MmcQ/YjbR family DNA-binding protein [Nocardioidaceae bacterium]